MGLSYEAEASCDIDVGRYGLLVDNGSGNREGVEGYFNGIGNHFAIFQCDACNGGCNIGGGHDAGLVEVEVTANWLTKAVEFF